MQNKIAFFGYMNTCKYVSEYPCENVKENSEMDAYLHFRFGQYWRDARKHSFWRYELVYTAPYHTRQESSWTSPSKYVLKFELHLRGTAIWNLPKFVHFCKNVIQILDIPIPLSTMSSELQFFVLHSLTFEVLSIHFHCMPNNWAHSCQYFPGAFLVEKYRIN